MTNRMVINVRGAGGSGKTTLVRHVLAHCETGAEPTLVWRHMVRAGGSKGPAKEADWPMYRCQVPGLALPIWVMGSYRQAQGGCDTCKDMDAIEAAVWRAAQELTDGHVLFEGMMVSGSAGRWATFSNRYNKLGLGRFLWLFLRLPKEELIRRVMQRNGGRVPQTQYYDENVEKQNRSRRAAIEMGTPRRWVVDLDAMSGPEEVWSEFLAVVSEREQDAP